jgi:hypothetical protein
VVPPGDARYRAIEPAYHDFALVKTAETNAFTDGTALHGLWDLIFVMISKYSLNLRRSSHRTSSCYFSAPRPLPREVPAAAGLH